jgi:recombination protein RecA
LEATERSPISRWATFLMENADVASEIEKKIKEKLGIGAVVTADVTHDEVLPAPVDF